MRAPSSSTPLRVCLLTGGGDAPGLNAAVRAFVHAATQRGILVYASRFGFEGLLGRESSTSLAFWIGSLDRHASIGALALAAGTACRHCATTNALRHARLRECIAASPGIRAGVARALLLPEA